MKGRPMPRYRITYRYHASGMELGPDERDYGVYAADTEEEAIEMALTAMHPEDEMYGPNKSYSARDLHPKMFISQNRNRKLIPVREARYVVLKGDQPSVG